MEQISTDMALFVKELFEEYECHFMPWKVNNRRFSIDEMISLLYDREFHEKIRRHHYLVNFYFRQLFLESTRALSPEKREEFWQALQKMRITPRTVSNECVCIIIMLELTFFKDRLETQDLYEIFSSNGYCDTYCGQIALEEWLTRKDKA